MSVHDCWENHSSEIIDLIEYRVLWQKIKAWHEVLAQKQTAFPPMSHLFTQRMCAYRGGAAGLGAGASSSEEPGPALGELTGSAAEGPARMPALRVSSAAMGACPASPGPRG